MSYFCIISFVSLAIAYGLPEITFVSKSQVIDSGGDVSLLCYILNPGDHSFSWTKTTESGKVQQISIDNTLKLNDPRYSLETAYNNNSFEFTALMRYYRLDIKSVTSNDNGTYDCLVYINDSLLLFNSTSLLVVPNNVKRESVLLGDSSYLECVSNKFRIANVVWTIYGKSVLPVGSTVDNGILIIPSTVSSDTGHYICHAEFVLDDNELFQVTRNVQLIVYFPLDVKTRNEEIVRPKGYDVNMTCIIETMFSIVVTWTKDNQPLSQDSRIQINLYDTSIEHGSYIKPLKVTQLHLKNIVEDDYGLYGCSAENEFGIKAVSIKLAPYI